MQPLSSAPCSARLKLNLMQISAPTYRRRSSGWWVNGADVLLAPHEGLFWNVSAGEWEDGQRERLRYRFSWTSHPRQLTCQRSRR